MPFRCGRVAQPPFWHELRGQGCLYDGSAAASLTCTLNAVTNPGDEVIVIAPYFPEYRVWIEKAGCTCVEALANEDTFQLSVDNVLKAITDKTAAVIIDSPNNPTGAVYTRDTLTRLANVLREVNAKRDPENPIMLISDEPYREIVYGAEVPGCLRSMSTPSCAIRIPSPFRYRVNVWAGFWSPIPIRRLLALCRPSPVPPARWASCAHRPSSSV